MSKLENKVVVVTGASQGIGAAYARAFASAGARVAVSDIISAEQVEQEIIQAGGKAFAWQADVTNPGSVQEMIIKITEKWGGVDVLINNAARFSGLERKPMDAITSKEWDDVMAVNVRGTFECIKAVLPYMKKRGCGKIINIASGTVMMGSPLLLHYVSSKGAVMAMTRALARELGEFSICVNCIAPGLTMSEGVTRSISTEKLQSSISVRSIKRAQAPEDIVGTALFLASPESDFITGQTIIVDGGVVFS